MRYPTFPSLRVSRSRLPALLMSAGVVSLSLVLSLPVNADGVTAVDPQTGHRVRLPDNDRDGRPDYIPQRLDVHVSPGLTQPRENRRERSSGGGSICQGNDGGSTVSTAGRACNPDAPAGDGGPRVTPDSSNSSTSIPTRPGSSSSTQLK